MMVAITALFAVQLISIALAWHRLGRRTTHRDDQPICLLVPVCGIDNHAEAVFRSFLGQDHPNHSVIFCAAQATDPVVPLLHRLIADHPTARLLTEDDDRPTHNPKLNNILKGWHDDASPIVAMVDSNAMLPPDYLRQLAAAFDTDTALVSSPPVGTMPQGASAAVEGAFLNTHQARWQFVADLFGAGFAQGKTLCWNRAALDHAGGPVILGHELAEDVASTKLAHALGQKVRLVARPVQQPLGRRTLAAVWSRQLRWARIRRQGFFWLFLPELLLGGALPLALLAFAAPVFLPVGVLVWYGAEWALARANGWPANPAAMIARDLMMPAIWLWSWTSRDIAWRGQVLVRKPA